MRLWTIQTEAAHQSLLERGQLFGDWRRVCKEFRAPYRWLCRQMELRGIDLDGRPPLWAWTRKPDLRHSAHLERGTTGVRLELEVPDREVLCSDFESWHSVLNNHYMVLTELELEAAFARPPVYSTEDVKKSWERIFDLRLFPEGTAQTTMPSIVIDYVINSRKFVAR